MFDMLTVLTGLLIAVSVYGVVLMFKGWKLLAQRRHQRDILYHWILIINAWNSIIRGVCLNH